MTISGLRIQYILMLCATVRPRHQTCGWIRKYGASWTVFSTGSPGGDSQCQGYKDGACAAGLTVAA
eukprot:4666078-Pyramimonas_sp.AAC.1